MAERKLITPRFRITVGDQVFTRRIRVECHSSLREQCSWATLEYDPGYAGLLDLASMAPAQVISIHSTTRLETHEMCESGEIPYISIHSTTRVETPDKIGFIAEAEFQSTPPRGWRLSIGVNGLAILKFQSTPPRGWRREVPRSPLSYLLFQSTPPRGWRPGRGGGETR